ncbi:MAG: CsgG/HfaB family protein [Smithellaceae bacterium]|nr:CsgG/HfaB family protein [Smithellaceae bacterium]
MQRFNGMLFLGRFFALLALWAAGVLVLFYPADGQAGDVPKPGKIRLAVLYFDNESLTDRERLEGLRKGIADTLISDLGRLDRFQVLERERLDALLAEMKLQQTGLVDPDTAVKIGRLLGVQALLLGSYTAIGGMIRLDARIVEVETGLLLKAEEVTGPVDDFFRLEEALVERIAAGLDAPLTTEERYLLARTQGRSFTALLAYARGIDAMDRGRSDEAEEAFAEALRIDPGFAPAEAKRKALKKGKGKP